MFNLFWYFSYSYSTSVSMYWASAILRNHQTVDSDIIEEKYVNQSDTYPISGKVYDASGKVYDADSQSLNVKCSDDWSFKNTYGSVVSAESLVLESEGKSTLYICENKTLPSYNAPIALAKSIDSVSAFESSAMSDESGNWKINKNQAKENISVWKKIELQPHFVSILYLQTQFINWLSKSIKNKKINFDFRDLFKNSIDIQKHKARSKKLMNFETKQEFIDSMSAWIWLSDVWIAQDIIYALYACAINNKCNWTLDFNSKDISSKYIVYSMKEIEGTLYKNTKNIVDESISYYNKLLNDCWNINIEDKNLRSFHEDMLNKIKSNDNSLSKLDYKLWYSAPRRIENLKTMRSEIKNKWTNLLWIFNFYNELGKLQLASDKISNLCSINSRSSNNEISKVIRENVKLNYVQELLNSSKIPTHLPSRRASSKQLSARSLPLRKRSRISSREASMLARIQALTPGTEINRNMSDWVINANQVQAVRNLWWWAVGVAWLKFRVNNWF